jgi:hypothetical protein
VARLSRERPGARGASVSLRTSAAQAQVPGPSPGGAGAKSRTSFLCRFTYSVRNGCRLFRDAAHHPVCNQVQIPSNEVQTQAIQAVQYCKETPTYAAVPKAVRVLRCLKGQAKNLESAARKRLWVRISRRGGRSKGARERPVRLEVDDRRSLARTYGARRRARRGVAEEVMYVLSGTRDRVALKRPQSLALPVDTFVAPGIASGRAPGGKTRGGERDENPCPERSSRLGGAFFSCEGEM